MVGGVFKANGIHDYNALTSLSGYDGMKEARQFGLESLYPEMKRFPPCPECQESGERHYGGRAIECLFMRHYWSKKAVAEWAEVIERKLGLWDEPSEAVKEAAPEPCETKERVKV